MQALSTYRVDVKKKLTNELVKLARAKNYDIDSELAAKKFDLMLEVYIESLQKYDYACLAVERAREIKFTKSYPSLDELVELAKKTAKEMDFANIRQSVYTQANKWPVCPKNQCDGGGLILFRYSDDLPGSIRTIPCDCHPLMGCPVWSSIENDQTVIRNENDLQNAIEKREESIRLNRL